MIDDEILVKGSDGKWYILRGEELVLREEIGKKHILPKGVKEETHKKFVKEEISPPVKKQPETPPEAIAPELPELAASLPTPPPIKAEINLAEELEKLVEESVRASGLVFSDANLSKRFRTIVSARLRDVRDAAETKDILMRDVKIGGLGLKEEDASRILILLDQNFQKFTLKWKEEEAKKIEEWKTRRLEASRQAEKERREREQFKIEEKYRQLVGEAAEKEIKPRKPVSAAKPSPMPPPKPKIETSKIEAKPPQITPVISQGKESRPRISPIKPEESKPPTLRVEEREEIKPAVPPPVIRPKVVDVRFKPRLLSPVEELQEMSLQDFRRLSPDARQTALKIRAKIDLLEEESFAKKMEGIKAWKQSSPAKLFFEISTAAVSSGKPIEAVIKEKEGRKEPALTIDEFYAIMELMKNLRF